MPEPQERLLIQDAAQGILSLLLAKVPKDKLADKISAVVNGDENLDREQVSLLKILLEAYRKQEAVEGDGFGINTDAILTASRLAFQDTEFLGVLASAIAERRHILKKDSGRVRADLMPILSGVSAEEHDRFKKGVKHAGTEQNSTTAQSGERPPTLREAASAVRVYQHGNPDHPSPGTGEAEKDGSVGTPPEIGTDTLPEEELF